MYRYTNRFHRTSTTSKYSREDLEWAAAKAIAEPFADKDAAYQAKKRIENKLCGSKACQCWGMVDIEEIK